MDVNIIVRNCEIRKKAVHKVESEAILFFYNNLLNNYNYRIKKTLIISDYLISATSLII